MAERLDEIRCCMFLKMGALQFRYMFSCTQGIDISMPIIVIPISLENWMFFLHVPLCKHRMMVNHDRPRKYNF